jgi:hypothetical protein
VTFSTRASPACRRRSSRNAGTRHWPYFGPRMAARSAWASSTVLSTVAMDDTCDCPMVRSGPYTRALRKVSGSGRPRQSEMLRERSVSSVVSVWATPRQPAGMSACSSTIVRARAVSAALPVAGPSPTASSSLPPPPPPHAADKTRARTVTTNRQRETMARAYGPDVVADLRAAGIGSAAWAITALATASGAVELTLIDLLLALAPLVIVPVGFSLAGLLGWAGRDCDRAPAVRRSVVP